MDKGRHWNAAQPLAEDLFLFFLALTNYPYHLFKFSPTLSQPFVLTKEKFPPLFIPGNISLLVSAFSRCSPPGLGPNIRTRHSPHHEVGKICLFPFIIVIVSIVVTIITIIIIVTIIIIAIAAITSCCERSTATREKSNFWGF